MTHSTNSKFCLLLGIFSFLALPSLAQTQYPAPKLQAAPPITLAAGAAPSDVAVGDFNNDRRADVAVSERGLNRMAVYLQTATGFPATATGTYPTGLAPSSVVVAPLDNMLLGVGPNDDLLVASGPSGLLSTFYNSTTSPGTYTVGPGFELGTSLRGVSPRLATAYLNSDTDIDLTATNDSEMMGNVVSYGWSFVQREFSRHSQVANAGPPTSVMLTDMDLNGYTDMVTCLPFHNAARVVLHSGFSIGTNYWGFGRFVDVPSGGLNPISAYAGDVNGDQYPDVAIANAGSNTVVYYVRTGPDRYTTPVTVYLPDSPRHVLLTDLNGDRACELVVATETQLLVYPNTLQTGPARFTTPTAFPLGGTADALRLADVNGDTYPDLLVPCAADHTVRIFHNTSHTTTTATRPAALLNVTLAPNPATNLLTLHRPASLGTVTVTLLDGLGRQVLRQELAGSESRISVEHLPRGLYVARVEARQGSMTQRLVLQ